MEDLYEPDELEESTDTPHTTEDIVSSGLCSGALCDITVTMRDVDTKEDLVNTFVEHNCGCDVGHKKSPFSKLFSADHFLSRVQWLR